VKGKEAVEMGVWWGIWRNFEKTLVWMKGITMDLQHTGWHGVYLIHVAQDREKVMGS
jgi:hypothetical protein